MSLRRAVRLVFVGFLLVVVSTLLMPPPVFAAGYRVCNHYGACTICDFYGSDGSYQGYMEWCF
jgi:hypothetical protein